MNTQELKAEIEMLQLQLIGVLQNKLPLTPEQLKIKKVIMEYLGEHITLNNTVPPEVGCAEAVSFILQKLNEVIASAGIAGTAALLNYCESLPLIYQEISTPEPFALLISATGTGNGTVEGHTGFFGVYNKMYVNDWGIVSNDSNTGILRELWSWSRWSAYYTQKGALPARIFRIKS
jgi:hypothetical protein